MIRRACQTADWPRSVRDLDVLSCIRIVDAAGLISQRFSWRRFRRQTLTRLAAQRPHLAVAYFEFDLIQRPRRRSVQDVSGGGVESAFMTGTLQSLALACVIDRTGQVRTLLAIRVISAVGGANQDRRVMLGGVMKIQSRVGRHGLSAGDLRAGEGRRLACVNRGLAGKTCRAGEQGRGSQPQKIAELATRDLRFFAPLIRKSLLIRLSRNPHVALVRKDALNALL